MEGQWLWLADPHGRGVAEICAQVSTKCWLTTASSERVAHKVPSTSLSARAAQRER
jgi:hypothetical protein